MESIPRIHGLNDQQVGQSRRLYGWNRIEPARSHTVWDYVVKTLKDPMVLLLLAASSIYFVTGSTAEGAFMAAAIVIVSVISLYQESRSRNAMNAIKKYSQPKIKIIRNGITQEFAVEQIVVGDYFIIEEGDIVPADGTIVQAHDLSLNEAILTGESLPVTKSPLNDNAVLKGTQVLSGLAVCMATKIGVQTEIGRIGKQIQEIRPGQSPLQVQVKDFVTKMAIAGTVIFLTIWIISFVRSRLLMESLLSALTLAMSILPEEIPVALSTFMALGAWRLIKMGIIVKETRTVETLGSATVICVDKTGTITKNEMSLAAVYDHATETLYEAGHFESATELITAAMWASEPIPFDPMEKALHNAYEKLAQQDLRPSARMVREYPLSGIPPVMTHVFEDPHGNRIIATKGAPEGIIKLCKLSDADTETINRNFQRLANQAYRVLAVADSHFEGEELPKDQREFSFRFRGLIGFHDPPKENIRSVLHKFYNAGIIVKLITGDNTITTQKIASQIHLKNGEHAITGEELLSLPEQNRINTIESTNIFTRMFPEAKLKVVEALKKLNHIVAMTGDGVNDGPALRAAHIGIAMGSKGSEVAKEASALVLPNDDLSGMVEAIAMGRKIYNNLKKAIQYIISIHIPIILIVFLPLALAWPYPTVFTPVHVIFLELIMGPTCSIIYENEPMEPNVMNEKPRVFSKSFFTVSELLTSLIQGLAITGGLVYIYWLAIDNHESLPTTAAMLFVTLISSNILLTLVNRSFYHSIFKTAKYRNRLIPLILALTVCLLLVIFTFPVLRSFFEFEPLDSNQILYCTASATISVIWFEAFKWARRQKE